MWTNHLDYRRIIEEVWATSFETNWTPSPENKLASLVPKLRTCNSTPFGRLLEKNKKLKRAQHKLYNSSPSPQVEDAISQTDKELYHLLLIEELYWTQKLSINWLKWGDCNARLFTFILLFIMPEIIYHPRSVQLRRLTMADQSI